MSGHKCPFCHQIMSINDFTRKQYFPNFTQANTQLTMFPHVSRETIKLTYYLCPNCKEHSIYVNGHGEKTTGISLSVYPISDAVIFPEFVPTLIRQDYEEAFSIVKLSPKASATLSRRCLQGMIRDFWGISKRSLAEEIDALEELIPAAQWKVLNSLRRLGNIGTHMERDINLIVDIDPGEAEKLVKLIEHLIEQWYIHRHDQEQLYADIIGIDEAKQEQRAR